MDKRRNRVIKLDRFRKVYRVVAGLLAWALLWAIGIFVLATVLTLSHGDSLNVVYSLGKGCLILFIPIIFIAIIFFGTWRLVEFIKEKKGVVIDSEKRK